MFGCDDSVKPFLWEESVPRIDVSSGCDTRLSRWQPDCDGMLDHVNVSSQSKLALKYVRWKEEIRVFEDVNKTSPPFAHIKYLQKWNKIKLFTYHDDILPKQKTDRDCLAKSTFNEAIMAEILGFGIITFDLF